MEWALESSSHTFCFAPSLHDVISDADAFYCKIMGSAEELPSYVDFFHLMALAKTLLMQ